MNVRFVSLCAICAMSFGCGPEDELASTAADELRRGRWPNRMRGFMVSPRAPEQDIRALAARGANLIRWQMTTFEPRVIDEPTEYARWLNSSLDHIESQLAVCEELGIKVVIDMHTGPGGVRFANGRPKTHRVLEDSRYRTAFLDGWDVIATRMRGRPAVIGYDLLNEPHGATKAWRKLARRAAKRIRKIDRRTHIIIEPIAGGPDRLRAFRPIEDVSRLVYSVHVYGPLRYTHQGIDDPNEVLHYPDRGRKWNRRLLKDTLRPVRKYQDEHGVPIFIGEFSAARWAPGAARYLADTVDLFERPPVELDLSRLA